MGVFEIAEFLRKRGTDLRAEDIDELRAMLALLPVEQYETVAGGVWETVALIVIDPQYEGDAKVPELPDSD